MEVRAQGAYQPGPAARRGNAPGRQQVLPCLEQVRGPVDALNSPLPPGVGALVREERLDVYLIVTEVGQDLAVHSAEAVHGALRRQSGHGSECLVPGVHADQPEERFRDDLRRPLERFAVFLPLVGSSGDCEMPARSVPTDSPTQRDSP